MKYRPVTARERERSTAGRCLLPRDRLPADVAAAEALRPADSVDRRIGARLRGADARAERRDIEDAAAGRHDAVAVGGGAGVEDLHALGCRSLGETVDPGAFEI